MLQVQEGVHPADAIGEAMETSDPIAVEVTVAPEGDSDDLSYYCVADRQGRSFKRLNELFVATGQVGFIASQRVDGKLILPKR